jgi:hypothetical protein
MKTKWVYKVESIQPPVFAKPSTRREYINEVLNRRGLEGWELINAPTIVQTSVMQFYFKRPF